MFPIFCFSFSDFPKKIRLLDRGKEISSRDNLEADRDPFEIECSAEGDEAEFIELKLYAGDNEIIPTETDDCREDDV